MNLISLPQASFPPRQPPPSLSSFPNPNPFSSPSTMPYSHEDDDEFSSADDDQDSSYAASEASLNFSPTSSFSPLTPTSLHFPLSTPSLSLSTIQHSSSSASGRQVSESSSSQTLGRKATGTCPSRLPPPTSTSLSLSNRFPSLFPTLNLLLFLPFPRSPFISSLQITLRLPASSTPLAARFLQEECSLPRSSSKASPRKECLEDR